MSKDLVLENFDFDPMDILLHEHQDMNDLYESGCVYLEQMTSKAATGATKANVFQKIWSFIKAGLRWIKRRFIKFVEWVKSLFAKKPQRSIDSILTELNVSKTSGPKSGSKVEFPADKRSEYKPPDIDLIIKPILVDINDDKSMTFTITDVMDNYDLSNGEVKQGGVFGVGKKIPVKGQHLAGRIMYPEGKRVTSFLLYAMFLIMHPENMNYLVNIVNKIQNKEFDDKIYENWNNLDGKLQKYLQRPPLKLTVTLDQILQFQSKLNELQEGSESLDAPDDSINARYRITDTLNIFSIFISSAQMGINILTATATGLYRIDGRYYESIKNINILSQFVDKCIKAAVPPKYIAYNAYLVSAPEIKGSKGNEDNPIWGQSRVVFFPTQNDKVVYKLALSGWGVRSNKSEYVVSEAFKKYGGEHLISATIGISKESTLIVSERVEEFDENNGDISKIIRLKDEIGQFCRKNNIKLEIDGDLHSGNVGVRNGKVIAIDYAYSIRS